MCGMGSNTPMCEIGCDRLMCGVASDRPMCGIGNDGPICGVGRDTGIPAPSTTHPLHPRPHAGAGLWPDVDARQSCYLHRHVEFTPVCLHVSFSRCVWVCVEGEERGPLRVCGMLTGNP